MANEIRGGVSSMGPEHDAQTIADRFLILPLALALLLIATAVLAPDLILAPPVNADMIRESTSFNLRIFDLLFLVIGFALLCAYLILAVVTVKQKRFMALASYGAAVVVLILSATYFKQIIEETQVVKIFLFYDQFEKCMKSGATYDNSSIFKICSTATHGNSFLSIMYDSGHQIGLPASQRSNAFNEFIAREVGPLLTECEVYSRNASGSFFLVRSDCG